MTKEGVRGGGEAGEHNARRNENEEIIKFACVNT